MTVTIKSIPLDARGVLIGRGPEGIVIYADPSAPEWLVTAAKRVAELYDDADQSDRPAAELDLPSRPE